MLPNDFKSLDRSFARFIAYSRDVRGHSSATIRFYEVAYANLSHFWMKHSRLSGVALLDRWVAFNRSRVCSTTVNNLWRGARAFYRFRHNHQRARDIFAGLHAPECPRSIPKALTLEQCRAVLDSPRRMLWRTRMAKERARALLATMLYAGLRHGELLRLRVQDVDLSTGTLRILRSKGRGGGKDRIAYIPPGLDTALRRYMRFRKRRRVDLEQLFVCVNHVRPLTTGVVQQIFHRLRLHLEFRVSPQILRHSFVTQMLHCGIPLHIASGLAGHATIQTTVGYLRVWNEEYHEWVARIRY